VRSEPGFSLIELVVVVAIIGVFFGLFGFNYTRSQERNQLRSATQELRSLIDLTRHNTLSGLVPEGCSISEFQGFGLDFYVDTEKVTLTYLCNNFSNNVSTFGFSKYPHIELESADNDSVYFLKGTAELLDSLGNKVSQTITLKNSRILECSQITINQFGLISTNDTVECP
jgi:prepilin-type N-terminal cleavage/methylation domain-containing protein